MLKHARAQAGTCALFNLRVSVKNNFEMPFGYILASS